jgi:hypothetical protein
MPKQKGIIKIKGTMGDITFYKSRDGYGAKEKTSLDGNKILTDPAFIRTRENGKEFGEAAKSGKLIRDAFRVFIMRSRDVRVTSRLTKLMSSILRLDATSARGARTVGTAIVLLPAMELLKSFNFNTDAILGGVMFSPYTLNTTTGVVNIPAFTPINELDMPAGSTHVSLTSGWAKVDFASKTYDLKSTNTVNLPINGVTTAVTLTPSAAPTGAGTSIFVLQAEFFQLVNTVQYSLKNGAYNALGIVEVL